MENFKKVLSASFLGLGKEELIKQIDAARKNKIARINKEIFTALSKARDNNKAFKNEEIKEVNEMLNKNFSQISKSSELFYSFNLLQNDIGRYVLDPREFSNFQGFKGFVTIPRVTQEGVPLAYYDILCFDEGRIDLSKSIINVPYDFSGEQVYSLLPDFMIYELNVLGALQTDYMPHEINLPESTVLRIRSYLINKFIKCKKSRERFSTEKEKKNYLKHNGEALHYHNMLHNFCKLLMEKIENPELKESEDNLHKVQKRAKILYNTLYSESDNSYLDSYQETIYKDYSELFQRADLNIFIKKIIEEDYYDFTFHPETLNSEHLADFCVEMAITRSEELTNLDNNQNELLFKMLKKQVVNNAFQKLKFSKKELGTFLAYFDSISLIIVLNSSKDEISFDEILIPLCGISQIIIEKIAYISGFEDALDNEEQQNVIEFKYTKKK